MHKWNKMVKTDKKSNKYLWAQMKFALILHLTCTKKGADVAH